MKYKNKLKVVLKVLIFIILFNILFFKSFNILWKEKTPLDYFYEEPKDSLDVLYIGSSSVYMDFNPLVAYKEYGFKTGLLSYGLQPFIMTKYLIEDSRNFQNPKLYVIDLSMAVRLLYLFNDGNIRNGIDSIKSLKVKNQLIDDINNYRHLEKENYLFSYGYYHNKWKDLFKGTANRENDELYKGFLLNEDSFIVSPKEKVDWNNDVKKIFPEIENNINNLINYLKSQNIDNVLFVISPRIFDDNYMLPLNYVENIIENNGYEFINFNNSDIIDIDFNKDLKDSSHLNIYGATKFSLKLSDYIKRKYNLVENDSLAIDKSWEKEYERFKNNYKDFSKNNFEDLINE